MTEQLDRYYEAVNYAIHYKDAGRSTFAEYAYLGLGIAGEAGESVDCIKKIYGMVGTNWDEDKYQDQKAKLKLELGDLLYYVVRTIKAFGWTPQEILDANIAKLAERHKND